MCVLTIQKKIKLQRYEYFIRIFEYILILPKKFLIQKYKITSLDKFSTYMFAIISCNISFTHFIRQRI